jgi:hypothetical protein
MAASHPHNNNSQWKLHILSVCKHISHDSLKADDNDWLIVLLLYRALTIVWGIRNIHDVSGIYRTPVFRRLFVIIRIDIFCFYFRYTRAICKVRGFTLLLRVATLWRCGDSLFFEVPALASDALLTRLHPLLEDVLQTVHHFEISCLGAPFSLLEKPRNRMGRDLNWILCSDSKKWIGGTPFEHPPYSPDLAPCDFWASPTTKRELRGKKFRSDQQSAARFREMGGAL